MNWMLPFVFVNLAAAFPQEIKADDIPNLTYACTIRGDESACAVLNQAGGYSNIENNMVQLEFNVSSIAKNARGCNIAEPKGPAQCFNAWDQVISPIVGKGASLTIGRDFAMGNSVAVTGTASLGWETLKAIGLSITTTNSFTTTEKCQYSVNCNEDNYCALVFNSWTCRTYYKVTDCQGNYGGDLMIDRLSTSPSPICGLPAGVINVASGNSLPMRCKLGPNCINGGGQISSC